jgi:hypothetical protein
MLKEAINVEAPVREIRLALPWPAPTYIAEHDAEVIRLVQEAIH